MASDVEPVALAHAMRDVAIELDAEFVAEEELQHRGARHPVDVVVAVDDDALPPLDRERQATRALLAVEQARRRGHLAEVRPEVAGRRLGAREAARREDLRDERGQTEFEAQGLDERPIGHANLPGTASRSHRAVQGRAAPAGLAAGAAAAFLAKYRSMTIVTLAAMAMVE
jgi:hypothetical protein